MLEALRFGAELLFDGAGALILVLVDMMIILTSGAVTAGVLKLVSRD